MDYHQGTALRNLHRSLAVAATLCVAIWSGDRSHAQPSEPIVVGLYAPSVPFRGPVERLDYASGLAQHLARRVGASRGIGRAYSNARDFNAAVKRGELDYAVVDSAYSAARGNPHEILATATVGGTPMPSWQLVADSPAADIRPLRGAKIAVPKIGAKNSQFLTNVLLGGEIDKRFFGKISFAPDTLSALAAVRVGRADAAFIPATVPLETGMYRILTVPGPPWPYFVEIPRAGEAGSSYDRDRVLAAVTSFTTGAVLTGWTTTGIDSSALARRFTRSAKRGPMAIPTVKLDVRPLLEGRRAEIPRPALYELVADEELANALRRQEAARTAPALPPRSASAGGTEPPTAGATSAPADER